MFCTVLRSFPGPAGPIEAGQVVDTSTWRKRNRDVLITRHYLREDPMYAVLHDPKPDPMPMPDPMPDPDPEPMPALAARQQRKN